MLIAEAPHSQFSFPFNLPGSWAFALAAVLASARTDNKTAVLLVNTTAEARGAISFLRQAFGSACRLSTTHSSLSDFVPCDLFADTRIIIASYRSFLRELLTNSLPSFHSIVFVHPLTPRDRFDLKPLLLDMLLLRLHFCSRLRSPLKKVFVCNSTVSSEQLYSDWFQVPFYSLPSSSFSSSAPSPSSFWLKSEQRKQFKLLLIL